jgi:hypothetical protein
VQGWLAFTVSGEQECGRGNKGGRVGCVDLWWHLDKRGVCWQDDTPSKRCIIPEKEISLAMTHECARSGKQKFAMRGGKGRAPARPPARNERDYGKV